MPPLTRAWLRSLAAGAALGVAAWSVNITTTAQLDGSDRLLWAVRTCISVLVNAGVVWAGLGVLAGWLVRRPGHAVLAAVAASELALVVHYAIGSVTGTMPWASWGDNISWFVAAIVLTGPLGLVGAAARRTNLRGLLARLVVPAGAITEPFVTGLIAPTFANGPADWWARTVAGTVLLAVGLVGAGLVLRRRRSRGLRATEGA